MAIHSRHSGLAMTLQKRLDEITSRLDAATPLEPFTGDGLSSIHFGGPSPMHHALKQHQESERQRRRALEALPTDLRLLVDALKIALAALGKIDDPRLRDHKEPDAYTELGCVMNMATEALAEIEALAKGGG